MKHGGESVFVWGCISTFVTGDLAFTYIIMDKNMYLNILKYKFLRKCQQNLEFNLHSNFIKIKIPISKNELWENIWFIIVRIYCKYNPPLTSSKFPDLNPTENLRYELESRIRKTSISSEDHIKHWLNEELKNVDTDYLKKRNL